MFPKRSSNEEELSLDRPASPSITLPSNPGSAMYLGTGVFVPLVLSPSPPTGDGSWLFRNLLNKSSNALIESDLLDVPGISASGTMGSNSSRETVACLGVTGDSTSELGWAYSGVGDGEGSEEIVSPFFERPRGL